MDNPNWCQDKRLCCRWIFYTTTTTTLRKADDERRRCQTLSLSLSGNKNIVLVPQKSDHEYVARGALCFAVCSFVLCRSAFGCEPHDGPTNSRMNGSDPDPLTTLCCTIDVSTSVRDFVTPLTATSIRSAIQKSCPTSCIKKGLPHNMLVAASLTQLQVSAAVGKKKKKQFGSREPGRALDVCS